MGDLPPLKPEVSTATAAPDPYSTTQAGIIFDYQQQQKLLEQQYQNALKLQKQSQAADLQREKQRLARERTKAINQLALDREGEFARLLPLDPVRATLLALGYGPDHDKFAVRASQLSTTVRPLKGARGMEKTQETALYKLLGRRVDIGKYGVRRLGSAQQAARAFAQGGVDVQTLLTSAFGVGSLKKGEQPGLSAARLTELIEEVLPRGLL